MYDLMRLVQYGYNSRWKEASFYNVQEWEQDLFCIPAAVSFGFVWCDGWMLPLG